MWFFYKKTPRFILFRTPRINPGPDFCLDSLSSLSFPLGFSGSVYKKINSIFEAQCPAEALGTFTLQRSCLVLLRGSPHTACGYAARFVFLRDYRILREHTAACVSVFLRFSCYIFMLCCGLSRMLSAGVPHASLFSCGLSRTAPAGVSACVSVFLRV